MRVRTSITIPALAALAAGCSASGIHREHTLRFQGGAHVSDADPIEDATTGSGDEKDWGIDYAWAPARGSIGVEVGLSQSFTDGEGVNRITNLWPGPADAELRLDVVNLGLHYPLERFWGLETDLGLGLAFLNGELETNLDNGATVTFRDETPGAYARVATQLPITDAVAVGAELRGLLPFDDFSDDEGNATYETELHQLRGTVFVALTW